MNKLLIFDIGGVVVDFTEEYAYAYIAKRLKLRYSDVAGALSTLIYDNLEYGDITLKQFLTTASKKLGVHEQTFHTVWDESFEHTASLKYDTIKLINKLSRRYTIVGLSNITKSRYLATLHLLDKHTFIKIFASCYIRARKPDKAAYRKVLDAMHVKPSGAIFIDNLAPNVAGAQAMGIDSILFTNAADLELQLGKRGISD